MPGPSPLDWFAGMATAAGTGNPANLGLIAARPAAQALLTSKPYQSLMTTPSYAEGAVSKATRGLLKTKAGQNMLRGLGAYSLIENGLNPSAR